MCDEKTGQRSSKTQYTLSHYFHSNIGIFEDTKFHTENSDKKKNILEGKFSVLYSKK